MIFTFTDRILIERDVKEASVIVSEEEKEVLNHGKVVSRNHQCGLQYGDIAYFTEYAGAELEIDGKKYLSVKVSEIIAVTRDKSKADEDEINYAIDDENDLSYPIDDEDQINYVV